jgi:6-phosphogluconolactonase
MSEIKVLPDSASLTQAAAEHVVHLATAAIADYGRFSFGLSGGSTPRDLYKLLAAAPFIQQIDWAKVHIFWGDERCVPPDHPDSNYDMARHTLLDQVPLPPENVHRIQGELPPIEAASNYEKVLRGFFGNQAPRLDLLLLGMGDDGHTASLFPHTAALREREKWVVANEVTAKQTWRITFTQTAINAAANITFLVSGGGKAERLRQVIKGPYTPDDLPSQLVKPQNGSLVWLIDSPAAALL